MINITYSIGRPSGPSNIRPPSTKRRPFPAVQRKPAPLHSSCSLLLILDNGVPLVVDQALCPHHLERIVDGVQFGTRGAMGIEVVVAPGEVLAVVDGEVHVVQGVVGRRVYKLLGPVTRDHIAVVDEDGPDLDGNEEGHVKVAVHGADEDEGARWGLAEAHKGGGRLTDREETERSRPADGRQVLPRG